MNLPVPQVTDSTEILAKYKEEFEDSLNASGLTEEQVITGCANILFNEKVNSREGIERISKFIEDIGGLGNDPFPLYHSFADGLYSREIHMPGGYFAVGKLHRHESMVYMLKGKVIVADENGTKVVEGPISFVSKPGIKRVGYVIEDVVWIDIHATDKTAINDAEKEIFVESYDEYEKMITDLGYTEKEVREISENTADFIEDDNNNIEIRDSDIEGKGVFSKKDIEKGEVVGIARIKLNRTSLGRYANHSFNNNAKAEINGDEALFTATETINSGDEITVNYNQVRKIAIKLDSAQADAELELCQV